jgi:ribonuclease Z
MMMQLIFLGTGGSWPSKERNVPAVALKIDGEIILFDCAEGTQRQFMYSTTTFMQVNKILISHFHGDHFLGLPGMVQSMYLNDRTRPLDIYGPKGTGKLISSLLKLGYFSPTFDIRLHDLEDGETIEFPKYTIKCREVSHSVPTLAYCVEERERPGKFNLDKAKELDIPEGPEYRALQQGKSVAVNGKTISPEMVMGPPRKGRKIVYSGDTKPCDAVIELAAGSDVLIHDATLDQSLEDKAEAYDHSSSRQAAEVAKAAKVKMLFLIHISPRYRDADILEKEAQAVFPNSVAARDFLEFDVKPVK